MRKLNYFVMLGISASLMLASCSQQRYANRAKVRVNEQATEQVKEKKEVATIAPKPSELVKPKLNAPEEAKALKPVNVTPKPKEVLKQLTTKETGRYFRDVMKDPKQIRDLVVKPDNQTKLESKENTSLDSTGKWLTWIIIGLVLLVIAIFVQGGLGSLLYLIGSIFIVVGLIFLLLQLLGS